MKKEIADRPWGERVELLAARDFDGTPGLAVALEEGHCDAIKALGKRWSSCRQGCAPSCRCKAAGGDPGVFRALREGRGDAVKAFNEMVERVPLESRAAAHVAKNAKRVLEFLMALPFGKVVERVPPGMRAEVVAAGEPMRLPGFTRRWTMWADAVEAFGELVRPYSGAAHALT